MKDLKEYLARYHAEKERLGLKSSGTMESMEQMDKSDTTRYDVVMIPRKPEPRDTITYAKQEHDMSKESTKAAFRKAYSNHTLLNLSPEEEASLAELYGLDKPIPTEQQLESNQSPSTHGVLLVKAGINQRLREYSRFLNLTGSRDEINKLLDAHSGFLYVVVAVLLWRIVYALMQS
jgi:hypothetical protein